MQCSNCHLDLLTLQCILTLKDGQKTLPWSLDPKWWLSYILIKQNVLYYTSKRTLSNIKTYFLVQQNVLSYQQHALLYTPKSTFLHNKMYIIIPQNKFYFTQNALYCRRILISGTNIHRVTSFCQLWSTLSSTIFQSFSSSL